MIPRSRAISQTCAFRNSDTSARRRSISCMTSRRHSSSAKVRSVGSVASILRPSFSVAPTAAAPARRRASGSTSRRSSSARATSVTPPMRNQSQGRIFSLSCAQPAAAKRSPSPGRVDDDAWRGSRSVRASLETRPRRCGGRPSDAERRRAIAARTRPGMQQAGARRPPSPSRSGRSETPPDRTRRSSAPAVRRRAPDELSAPVALDGGRVARAPLVRGWEERRAAPAHALGHLLAEPAHDLAAVPVVERQQKNDEAAGREAAERAVALDAA